MLFRIVPAAPTATTVFAFTSATPVNRLPCGSGFCQNQPGAASATLFTSTHTAAIRMAWRTSLKLMASCLLLGIQNVTPSLRLVKQLRDEDTAAYKRPIPCLDTHRSRTPLPPSRLIFLWRAEPIVARRHPGGPPARANRACGDSAAANKR